LLPTLAQDAQPKRFNQLRLLELWPCPPSPGWEAVIADFNKEYPGITVNPGLGHRK